MSTSSFANSYYDPQDPEGKNRKKKGGAKGDKEEPKEKTPIPMWVVEACVNPQTANSQKWLADFIPMATQLLLADRPAHIMVRNSWNPVPFEHFPSQPATWSLKTPNEDKFVSTDAKVWSRNEIRAVCEDCDFISGNMWFYIPTGIPRSPDDLFDNVFDPLVEWTRAPSGVGECIGSAEDALALLHWNAPEDVANLGAEELKKLAKRLGIVIENEDAMVIDCLQEDFFPEHPDSSDENEAPRRIPWFDWFWLGIMLILLQLVYLMSKFDFFRGWFSF